MSIELHGLRTAIYPVADIDAAKAWWSRTIGQEPYFDQPFYVGFEVGGYELGLLPAESEDSRKDGAQVYWGVTDVAAAVAEAVADGAQVYAEPSDVGDGIIVALVRTPGGSLLGLIHNPHFKVTATDPS